MSFDLSTARGKLMRTIHADLAEFERDLIREWVKSGLAGESAALRLAAKSAAVRQKGSFCAVAR
jgi:DNA invertase Pin-like site-specific DNA recombinase